MDGRYRSVRGDRPEKGEDAVAPAGMGKHNILAIGRQRQGDVRGSGRVRTVVIHLCEPAVRPARVEDIRVPVRAVSGHAPLNRVRVDKTDGARVDADSPVLAVFGDPGFIGAASIAVASALENTTERYASLKWEPSWDSETSATVTRTG